MRSGARRAPLLISLAAAALLLLLPLISLAVPTTAEWGEDSKRLGLMVMASAILLSLAGLGTGQMGTLLTRRAVPLALFALWLILVSALGRWPGRSLTDLIPTLIGIGLCLAIQSLPISRGQIARWWVWVGVASTLAALLAFDPLHIMRWAMEGYGERYALSSTFANPLSLAGFLAPACCLALARLIGRPRPSPVVGLVTIGALIFWIVTLLMTASRGPTLALIIGVGATVLFTLGKRAIAPRTLVIGLCCALAFFAIHFALGTRSPAKPLIDRIGQGALHSESIHHRITLWTMSGQMIRRAPILGHGWGSYPMLFQEQLSLNLADDPDGLWELEANSLNGRVPRHVHCDYLELVVSGGVPALGLFLWILVESLGLAATTLRRTASGVNWPLAGAAGAVVCLAALAVVDFPMQRVAHATLLWIAMGVCRRGDQPLA